MGGEYVGPLDNQLSSQRENPEFNSGPLFEWVKKCAIASENYRGLNEGEERDIFELFDNYEKFLTEHFSIGLTQKKFATAAERDGYLKSLIISELGQGSEMANKPLVGQEFLSSMSLSLRRKALADGEPEEVCKSLGIVFNKTDSTYVPTAARTPIETGSGAGFDRGEIRNKLGELLPALIESKLFGENIIVTEGRVSGNQMRVAAYLVVEMPSLQKQILICNELGEAAFVSHVWLGSHIFEEAGKGELQEGYGLTRVVYDKGGNWLERIKELLLKAPEDFSAEEAEKFRALTPVQKSSFLLSRRKINTVEFAQTRRELLDKYPTSKEYLQQLDIWYQNENFAISASQRRRICKQMLGQGPGSDTLINVTKESMIHCGFALYGANDANLNYVYKVEWKRDKGYLTQVLKEGLPEGLTIVKSGFKGFKNSEEFVDEFNLGGTLQRERHCMQLLGFG